MPLTPTREIIDAAHERGAGVGAFNVIHLETAEALVAGAESAGHAVILQISQNCVAFHGTLPPLGLACLTLAAGAAVPVAVHLDHAEDEALAREAVDLGFGSVMYDGATHPYAQNVAATRRVVQYAHARGVFVEAELGAIGGKDGAHAPGVRTDPTEAVSFVEATGVDALAVAVGSSHAMTQRVATLDLELIARLRAVLDVPLVLHGSSGVPDDQLTAAIRAGMTKINVSTQLNRVFTQALRGYLAAEPTVVDSRKYVRVGRSAVAAEAARLLTLLSLDDPENKSRR
ncbi:MAG: class II fructose-bisphosphate aldolase [Terrimesophilobacter sp.]